ncbi:phosphotransferase family enzyme [Hoeflea halophila]|uniref:Phosphotransferase family enzyme n=1 Tax=Hoeflea halophila TaxID=714899 RepID=A0A286ICG3_9HYPH|nr:phosphotransferase [Hoeflea halophila]SOE17805.1 phosphotransferase family enzyme [Hoeflea halophila]
MMTSETDFNAPAHPGHDPIPLRFSPVDGKWLSNVFADLPIERVEKAANGCSTADAGYYRLTLADGRLLFAKVKSGERATREHKAAELSSQLNRLGAATLAAERTRKEDGLSLFLYPWIEPAFYDDSLKGLANLGGALALLHSKMRNLPQPNAPGQHLLDIWADRLRLARNADHAADYLLALSRASDALARTKSQIAHNDIHRGNVIFEGSEVVAFIDFEDAVDTRSSPLIDIAASLERFCLSPAPSEIRVRALLTGYANASDGTHAISACDITHVGLCRCYHALTVLELSKDPENPAWRDERDKFLALLDDWPQWGEIIGRAFDGLLI